MLLPSDGLRLRLHPDPVLRERAEPVGPVDDRVRELVDGMIAVMRRAEGIGLAAPQVGVSKRLFICDVPAENLHDERGAQLGTEGVMVCIDPEITEPAEDRSPFEEGCLSLPGIRGDVIRPETVRMTAAGLHGKRFSLLGGGLLARCWQHEQDHLDGVLIIDKMSQMARLKNRRRLRELEARA